MKQIDGIPRRIRLDHCTPAELAIVAAVKAVEEAGAHPLLTDAVVLLGQARDKVADFVDLEPEFAWLIEIGQLCVGQCNGRLRLVTFTDEQAIRFQDETSAVKYIHEHNILGAVAREHQWG